MKNLNLKQISIAASLSLLFAAQVTFAGPFDDAWAAAEAKRVEAKAAGYEWRDTGKMLKSAKQAMTDGDADKANALVEQALEQSNDALAQAERESKAWASRVPK